MAIDREELLAAGVLAAIVLAAGGGCYAWGAKARAARARFAPAVSSYLEGKEAHFGAPADAIDAVRSSCGKDFRCRRGKVVVISVEDRDVDPLQVALPPEIRAESPEEVGTLALLSATYNKSGWFGPFSYGYSGTWDLRLIDWKTKKPLGCILYSAGAPTRGFPIPFYKHKPWKPTSFLAGELRDLPAK
ncbi:MAG: hypothetical protein HY925_07615 [Elusimicrobia bacterium]|nr:hypothetical protein [Elusimicrobiota bacterium]